MANLKYVKETLLQPLAKSFDTGSDIDTSYDLTKNVTVSQPQELRR